MPVPFLPEHDRKNADHRCTENLGIVDPLLHSRYLLLPLFVRWMSKIVPNGCPRNIQAEFATRLLDVRRYSGVMVLGK